MIARATDSRIIHKPMDLNQVVEANGPGWTGSLTPARVDPPSHSRSARHPHQDHPADPMGRRQSWPTAITQLTPLIPLRRMVQVRVLSEA